MFACLGIMACYSFKLVLNFHLFFSIFLFPCTDNVPPTLTCPESITRTIPLENGCVDVIWTIPFVSDDSGGQVDVMSTPASGTCFPVNSVMNVLVTGMDPSGNVATCQFSVTVTAAGEMF